MARAKKQTDEALLASLACGATVEQAARAAGMSPRTAHRRLKDPDFRQRLQDRRAEITQRTIGMLTAAGLESVKTLITLQTGTTPAAVRLGAARSVLELGIKLRENAELTERIAALEAQAAGAPPDPAGS
jgi:hypothetical protein